jgi:DNA end-binding protein Ku
LCKFEFASWLPLRSGQAISASLVNIPVRLVPAISTEEAISFRQIHEPSSEPIRYVKGIETEKGFKEIVKGYEYAKGRYVLIDPRKLMTSNLKPSTPSTCGSSWIRRK